MTEAHIVNVPETDDKTPTIISEHESANALIKKFCETLDSTHKVAINKIESALTTLTNFKALLEVQNEAAKLKARNFIISVGQVDILVKKTEDLIQNIEEIHLGQGQKNGSINP